MQKTLVKTAVKTALIILGALIAFFAVFNLAFPQHMATAMENMGSYGMAVKYADLRYSYTGTTSDLARCFDDSVLAGNDKKIISYGKELKEKEDFAAFCEQRDSTNVGIKLGYYWFAYEHRVNSYIAVALYNEGETDEAISVAASDNGTTSFSRSNSLITLASAIVEAEDSAAAAKLLTVLNGISTEASDEVTTLNQVKEKLNALCA